MTTQDTSREPCPDRILDDIGGAFAMGAIGGSAFHFLKGVYNSPTGSRFIGATEAVAMKTPRVAGGFAVWGGLFSAFDCTMVYARQKEDPWNSIIAGAATGGFLQMRQGLRPAGRSALVGGVLLALIEGVGITRNKVISAQQTQPVVIEEAPQVELERSSASSLSWFGGLFGGRREEEKPKLKVEVLESFDSPMPPTFEFR
ncbi:hypothetical protein HanXRQr2_Chr12g0522321 [Helianthus annuus]|uniref:Uncharacterized protein n=1 Tax=Helianthus annuus TaxID=4232 RepID=A0A251SYX5_HELAN|nr:mitochondrial import inner membrane translocase subunit TIM17-2 [Helianthus annuus]KAF5776262.1 hypothetical protein HanXRQr2_Chr12g0522321 [Helianthus annuus]KAJ0488001.1 hypothetical protein HanHA300_Chr12g0428231 [Helianthus annuus]KAJ0503810.1 hypothetical protein HanHA89_Chr12g0452481 [Helianthus annuus]KAJ0861145.1 hypothetical protein HanPSC8_Chr12g0503441 [Helianthus annuus]